MLSIAELAVVVESDYLVEMELADIPIGVDLDQLLKTVGPTVADLVFTPERRETTVRGTVIEDVGDPLPVTPSGLLLLVGISADDPAALLSVERAANAGFAGVVVKRRGRPLDAIVDAANEAGLAVVAAADEIGWRHFDALISSALGSVNANTAGTADTDEDELFSIANAVAAVVGGSVAIEDLAQHVLAYSSIPGQRIDSLRRQGILDRRVPPGPDDLSDYRSVFAADGVIRFRDRKDELPRAAIALRAGTVALGTLWAIEGEDEFSAQAERALIEGAQLAALHMLRARSALDLGRLRRGELLRALLEATGTPDSTWPRLGFGPGDHAAIIGLSPSWSSDDDPLLITNIAREVMRVCHALRPDAPVTTSPRTIYVLLAGPEVSGAAIRLARRIVVEISRSFEDRLHAAVSSEGHGPRSVSALRDEVDQILRVAAEHSDWPDVVTISDAQSSVLLAHLGDELDRHPELRHPALAQLLEQDRETGTNLAGSLLVWLESQQNVQAAAARLHVHPNTLRYRLKRIRELAPIDLDDGDQRLAAWLELRLYRDVPGR